MSIESFKANAKGKKFSINLYREIVEVIQRNQKLCPDDNFCAYLTKALAGQFLHFKGTELESLEMAKEYIEEKLLGDIAENVLESSGSVVQRKNDGTLIHVKR